MDPTGLWKQWYETSSKAWSAALENGKEGFVDPYGLYTSWLKRMGSAQEEMRQGNFKSWPLHPIGNPREVWQEWFDGTIEMWRQAAQAGGDPLGMTARWLAMMEETRDRVLSRELLPSDIFTMFREWYEATSETWAKVVNDTIGTEQFIESASPFLESYATFYKSSRRANEEYFKNLQLPTRSDIARVAELIVNLEEKVDRIDDASATTQQVEGLTKRLDAIEHKLDSVIAALEQANAAPKPTPQPTTQPQRVPAKKPAKPVEGKERQK